MLRRLPTAELLRRLVTISVDFRFPNHCSPTEPIRGLPNITTHLHDSRDQTNAAHPANGLDNTAIPEQWYFG